MPLRSVSLDIVKREDEACLLIDMLKTHEIDPGKTQACAIFKSSAVLLLYNAIEATIYNSLELFHDRLAAKDYVSLPDSQRHFFATLYFEKSENRSHKQNIDAIINGSLCFPALEEYIAVDKMFSGNLDARKIDATLVKYGVLYSVDSACRDVFLNVKTLRNKLAHGEESFSSACRDMVTSDIESMTSLIFESLKKIITEIESHLLSLP